MHFIMLVLSLLVRPVVSVIDSVWKADISNEWFMNKLMKQREALGRPCTIINTHKGTLFNGDAE